MSGEVFKSDSNFTGSPVKMDAYLPVMRLKGKRKVIQSIQFCFQQDILSKEPLEKSATSIAGSGSPTSECFLFFPSQEKRQIIYQSISSEFSRRSSPNGNSPQPTFLVSQSALKSHFSTNPSPTSEEEDNFRMIDEVLSPMRE